jgi:hypothetical protein
VCAEAYAYDYEDLSSCSVLFKKKKRAIPVIQLQNAEGYMSWVIWVI